MLSDVINLLCVQKCINTVHFCLSAWANVLVHFCHTSTAPHSNVCGAFHLACAQSGASQCVGASFRTHNFQVRSLCAISFKGMGEVAQFHCR